MSNMRDGPVLKAVAAVVKDHVRKAFDVLRGRVDGLEQRIKELPTPERGDKGDPGDSGTAGPPGVPGEKGLDGRNGDAGIQGPAGNDGKEGAQGLRGEFGPLGPVGERGESGSAGKDGKDGKDGLTIKGDIGPAGKDGRDGIDGKDAPPIDTKALTGEIVETVLKQIPAPVHGKDGRDGNDAEQLDVNDIVSKILGQIPPPIPGKDGKDAPVVDTKEIVSEVLAHIPAPINGKDVDQEALSVRITSEVVKAIAALPKPAAGRDGRDGRVGEQGESGKDALEMDIINGIDETASYQRGIFAKHRNGLFRAYRTTDPVVDKDYEAAGWMCVVAGVIDVIESADNDQRTIIRSHELSDGSLITTKYKTPALIYRGVFKEGQRYETGDAVTNAGAMWMCGAPTLDKPGLSKDWTLAVKRGSDGKDLRPRDDNDPPLNGKGSVYLGAKR